MAERARIFISAGEASGDVYGALLVRALRERIGEAEFFGCGGARLQAAGCQALVDAREVTMVGLVEVIPGLPRAWRALQALKNAIRQRRPHLAVLIDFPDFNLRLARELHRCGIPVLYFVAPQVWAWRRGRLKTIRRCVDRLMCLFPFEEEFFRRAGIAAEFVGHPLARRARPAKTSAEFRRQLGVPSGQTLLALVPGSRRKEIELNLPVMIEAARRISATRSCAFVLPAAPAISPEWLRERLGTFAAQAHIVENQFYDAVAHAQAAVVASGTASTETAFLGTPLVIVYRVSGLSWRLGRWMVKVPFFSMVNLVAGREVVRELIQDDYQAEAVAAELSRLLDVPAAREKMRADLLQVTRKLENSSMEEGAGAESAALATRASGPENAVVGDPIQRTAAVAESMLKRAGVR